MHADNKFLTIYLTFDLDIWCAGSVHIETI